MFPYKKYSNPTVRVELLPSVLYAYNTHSYIIHTIIIVALNSEEAHSCSEKDLPYISYVG